MRYVKTFEKFNYCQLNESIWQSLIQGIENIKEWISNLYSGFVGDLKEGCEFAQEKIEKDPNIIKDSINQLSEQEPSKIVKLFNWIKSFTGKAGEVSQLVNESYKEEIESILITIGRLTGFSTLLVSMFSSPAIMLYGLSMSNSLLFLVGLIVGVISYSIVSYLKEKAEMDEVENGSRQNW